MNKNESKYFNTAKRMDKALISLLEKKDFAYITVKEICEAAEVNRSTFYLHYENTSDLLRESVRYILDGFLGYFNVETRPISDYSREEMVFIDPQYLRPYLTYIKENRKIFATAVKHLGTMNFEDVYGDMLKYVFDPILEKFSFPVTHREYVMKFYLTGITAIVMEWLENDCCETYETMIEIITECVFGKC